MQKEEENEENNKNAKREDKIPLTLDLNTNFFHLTTIILKRYKIPLNSFKKIVENKLHLGKILEIQLEILLMSFS